MCKQWDMLPRSGGWHEQDHNELVSMNLALKAYRIGQVEKEYPDKLTPDDYRFIDWMFDDGSTTLYFS